MNARDVAVSYIKQGRSPVPVPLGSKVPALRGWQALRITEDTVNDYFNGHPLNVSVLNGEPSSNEVDVDLDVAEALSLQDCFLPSTDSVFGRPSAPRSHRLYIAEPLPETRQFEDVDGTMLVELRSTGSHTLRPPSVADGEARRWDEEGPPSRISGDTLTAQVAKLAAATIIVRHYPSKGSRHLLHRALAGALLRANWTDDEVEQFILAIARAAGDDEARARVKNVATTGKRLDNDRKATGWPALAEQLGEKVVDKVRDWLGIDGNLPRIVFSQDAPSKQPAEAAWPEPMAEEAYHGLLGEFVRAVEPHSEADPAAILAHGASGMGALVGRHVRAEAGDAPHPARINTLIVGLSAIGRKGSAYRATEKVIAMADPSFSASNITEGLSSGEGLIWQVRDPIYKNERVGKGADTHYEEVEVDPGVDDKRLWVVESEFATPLRVMQRDGNTLSAILRRAWDRDDLRTLTKNSPARASGAHIPITGHISKDELLRYLDRSELASGLVNRFLTIAARRGRVLPDGEGVPPELLAPLSARLSVVVEWARTPRLLRRDEEARAVWHQVYESLSSERTGMFGGATNRGPAQVLRLSVLYAILDCAEAIRVEHLMAALAVWRYAEQSARWVFGDALGDPTADTILGALRRSGALDREDMANLFGRHASRSRLDSALALLLSNGLARVTREPTGGRPREVWHAA